MSVYHHEMRARAWTAITVVAAFVTSEAHALCVYHGVIYAKPTLAQEFADSKWVVRAKVLSARDRYSDTDDSWTTYRIEVRQSFKGAPLRRLVFFTLRDSGGFYLDNGMSHDMGGDYLLFLNPNTPSKWGPAAIGGTVAVTYSVGSSRGCRRVICSGS